MKIEVANSKPSSEREKKYDHDEVFYLEKEPAKGGGSSALPIFAKMLIG